MNKFQVIKQPVLEQLDRLCFVFSFFYAIFFFLDETATHLNHFFMMALFALLVYLAKRQNDIIYGSFAYLFFTIILLQFFIDQQFVAEHQLFVLLPFLVFFIALIKGLPTTFLSGVLYGYWLFFFYKLYETFKSDVPKPVVQSFSTARHTELMANIPIFVGLGVLFFLLSERNPVSLKVNWLETIDYALFILTGVFLYNWFQLGFQYQYLLIDLVYGVLTFTSYRAKITGKKFFAAASYAVLSVIVIDDVKAAGLIEQTTIGLIVPLLVFIVGLLVRIPTAYITTIVITYWFYSFYFSANLEGSLLTKLFMQSVRPEILAQTRASFGSIVIIGIILGIILQIVMKKKQKKRK